MCPPDHFDVAYVINPWMEGQFARTDPDEARRQWEELKKVVERHAVVSLLPSQENLPDLVFTANAALVKGKKAVLSHFRCAERRGEEKFDRRWFEENGFQIVELPPGYYFEGAGDALYDETRDLYWIGHGFRSDERVAPLLQALLMSQALTLNLIDPRFYHLDTCFCPLPDGYVLYYPGAFDEESRQLIEKMVPEKRRIAVDVDDALKFCCNAISLNGVVIMNDASPALMGRLREAGLTPVLTPLWEFLRAGGAAKCLTLAL